MNDSSAVLPTLKNVLLACGSIAVIWLPVLALHLVIALFAALITYGSARAAAGLLRRIRVGFPHADAVGALLVILLLVGAVFWMGHLIGNHTGSQTLPALLQHMAVILDQLHMKLPPALAQNLPASVESVRVASVAWLRDHASELQLAGVHTLRGIGHLLAGIVIGAIAVVQIPPQPPAAALPLATALRRHFDDLVRAFNSVFFAQFRISLINTALTAVFLFGLLPLLGKQLPMSGMLLAVTFVCGLIPVVGNLISNAVIVIISLSDSLAVTLMSLLWLVSIHKFEYFLNAEIIGQRISAAAWELLIVMLVFEAVFGLAGLVSAPVIYAQIKHLMKQKGWIN